MLADKCINNSNQLCLNKFCRKVTQPHLAQYNGQRQFNKEVLGSIVILRQKINMHSKQSQLFLISSFTLFLYQYKRCNSLLFVTLLTSCIGKEMIHNVTTDFDVFYMFNDLFYYIL